MKLLSLDPDIKVGDTPVICYAIWPFICYNMFMPEISAPIPKEPTINLAVGPSCPVRCEGCYNHFGDTARIGGLVTAEQVIDFATDARDEGVTQATLSGG